MFDSLEQPIPARLDELDPGPVLAAWLETIDVEAVSGYDRVVVLRAHQRMVSHYQARMYQDMASVSDALDDLEDVELIVDAAVAEIRAGLRLNRRSADAELSLALDLRHRLPQVWKALARGEIDLRRARTIHFGTEHLSLQQARAIADLALREAPDQTTGQLSACVRRLCIEVDPDDARRRYQRDVVDRRVVTESIPAGTAHLLALHLPPDRVAAASARINQLARSLKTASEERTMDQLRADVLLELVEGRSVGGSGRGKVDIRVDLTTLAGLSENPGELAGYGPVIADIARQATVHQRRGQWHFTVIDPDTDLVVSEGITRRRPTLAQRRHVESRTPTCVFPGCRMPATACDLDHLRPFAQGGPTSVRNLGPLCRYDHGIKHRAGWIYRWMPDGLYRWTSRLGHT